MKTVVALETPLPKARLDVSLSFGFKMTGLVKV
jgi:hypothetical protein